MLALAFFFTLGTMAQPTQKSRAEIRLGDKEYIQNAFRIAIQHYKSAYAEDSVSHDIQFKLARCYYRMRDFEEAEVWANKLVDGGYSFTEEQMYYYIEILVANQHYAEAKYWYEVYLTYDTANEQRLRRLESFLLEPDYESMGADYWISPLNINSRKTDFAPTYYKDGIVYVSARKEKKVRGFFKTDGIDFLSLYYAERVDKEEFTEPVTFSKDLESSYHEGPVAFYKDEQKIVFTRSNFDKNLFGANANKSESGSTTLNLYFGDVSGDTITNITSFPYNSDEYTCAHPAISEDGTKLIFSANMEDSYGNSDLYICYWRNNEWSYPRNMGDEINTQGSELFPYLEGNVLYFSSDGHVGFGGMDNYFTTLVKDKPTEIINPGYQVNSSADDFSMVSKDGNSYYFSSNRGHSKNDDIYYAELKPPGILKASIRAIDESNGNVLKEPDVELIDTTSKELLLAFKTLGDSIFEYQPDTMRTFRAIVSHKGYLTSDTLFFSGSETEGELQWDVPMALIQANKPIRLNNIYYDFDKASLRDTSKVELNRLIKWMEENDRYRVQIRSHSDSRGSEDYNMNLSQRRAQSVVDYLVESGIEASRLEAQGFGETEPIFPCPDPKDCTAEQHQKNRRTEFMILDSKGTEPGLESPSQESTIQAEEDNE